MHLQKYCFYALLVTNYLLLSLLNPFNGDFSLLFQLQYYRFTQTFSHFSHLYYIAFLALSSISNILLYLCNVSSLSAMLSSLLPFLFLCNSASSAKRLRLLLTCGISFTYIKNIIGTCSDPWGTPLVTLLYLDFPSLLLFSFPFRQDCLCHTPLVLQSFVVCV